MRSVTSSRLLNLLTAAPIVSTYLEDQFLRYTVALSYCSLDKGTTADLNDLRDLNNSRFSGSPETIERYVVGD